MHNTTEYNSVFLILDKETKEFVFRYYPSSQPKKALFQTQKHAYDAIKGNTKKYQIIEISAGMLIK